MGRRMSNRDRIDRMRAEAEATEREKEKERARRAASDLGSPSAAKRAKARDGDGDVRLKVVWAVKDPNGEILATYPYPRKDLAEAEAKRLRAADGRSYIVTRERVPMDEG